jgi:hypothetical protein
VGDLMHADKLLDDSEDDDLYLGAGKDEEVQQG